VLQPRAAYQELDGKNWLLPVDCGPPRPKTLAGMENNVPQRLKPAMAASFTARLKPCPSQLKSQQRFFRETACFRQAADCSQRVLFVKFDKIRCFWAFSDIRAMRAPSPEEFNGAGQSGCLWRRGTWCREQDSRPWEHEARMTSMAMGSRGRQRNWTRQGLELGRR
jgi:hypothetical protein